MMRQYCWITMGRLNKDTNNVPRSLSGYLSILVWTGLRVKASLHHISVLSGRKPLKRSKYVMSTILHAKSHRYVTLKIFWELADGNTSHYDDVTMSGMASQTTSLTIVYSTVYSDADQRKHQSPASLASVREFTGDRWIPRTNGQ